MANAGSMIAKSKGMPRRAALLQTACAGLVAARPAFALTDSSQTPQSKFGVSAKSDANLVFAAVQMEPDVSNSARTVGQMVKAMGEVSRYKSTFALIAFPSGMFELIHRDGTTFETLIQTVQKLGCVLTFGANAVFDAEGVMFLNARVLVEPSGQVSMAQTNAPFIKNTTVGRLAISSPECQHNPAGGGAEVEILMQPDPKGYSLSNIQTYRSSATLCSVVVNRASPKNDDRCPPTAIFDGKGRMITQTGNGWTQIIVASLPRRFK